MAYSKEDAKKAEKKYKASSKGRETYLRNHLKRKYNITLEYYKELLNIQDNKCAICLSDGDYRSWKDGRQQRIPFCVDHDHYTGNVRGLLCNKCNIGIAMLKEDIAILTNAINYLLET